MSAVTKPDVTRATKTLLVGDNTSGAITTMTSGDPDAVEFHRKVAAFNAQPYSFTSDPAVIADPASNGFTPGSGGSGGGDGPPSDINPL